MFLSSCYLVCHAAPSSSPCRQVGTPQGLTLRDNPCMTAKPILTTDLARGDNVIYTNMDSKQTSRCGAPPDPGVKPLCWVQVTVTRSGQNYTGFVPAVRGWQPQAGFTNAFCDVQTTQEPLLLQPCGGCDRTLISVRQCLGSFNFWQ
jgi:hypothetical protein